jgi:hypothetical protein
MKKILILLVVFAALLGWVYFYEIQGEKGREEARQLEQSLLKLDREKITEVEIVRADEEPVVLKKSASGWALLKPIESPANSGTVDSLLGALANAKVDRRIEKGASDAGQYGLAEPRVTLKLKEGQAERDLVIGGDDYTGNQVYVQVKDDPDVYLTSDYLFTAADKQLKDWRDRRVLTFDRAQLSNLEIDRGSERLRLRRDGEAWLLESPIQERADSGTVSSLISALEFAEAEDFVTEQPDNLRTYGLDNPSVSVRVREEGKDNWKALQFGRKSEDHYLARTTERSPVFTVKGDLYEKVTQKLWEFRDKTIVDVEQDNVAELSIRRPDSEVVLRREDDVKWIVQAPDSLKGKEGLSYKFWYPLTDIRYQSLEESPRRVPQPDKSAVIVTITLKDGSSRSYEFYQAGDRYLARKVDSNRVGTISKESFEALQFEAEEIV